jgi:hypothetical protein
MTGQVRIAGTGAVDEAMRRYRDEMDSEHQPVSDRLHQLIWRPARTPKWCFPTGCRHTVLLGGLALAWLDQPSFVG